MARLHLFEFEDQPYFAGFRQVASNGLPLPVLNVFRMYALMGPDRLSASSSRQVPLDSIVKNIDSVTVDEVQAVSRQLFDIEKFTTVIINPELKN